MHKKTYLLFLMLIFIPLRAHDLSMNFGMDFNYARYKLGCTEPQGGYIAGPHFDFAYKLPNIVYTGLSFDGRWNAGLICAHQNLDDCNNVSSTNTQAKVADYMLAWEAGYYRLTKEDKYSIAPFSGLGFQHLSYQLRPNAVRYKYNQIFLPIGLEFLYFSPRAFSIGFKASYRAGAYTNVHVSTPDVDDSGSTRLKLKYSQGVHLEAPATLNYLLGERVGFNLACVPFFDWNRFASTSETNSQGVVFPIPANSRWYLGVNANLGISF